VLLCGALLFGCSSTKKSDQGAAGTIPAAGGDLTVSSAESSLAGASISVPAGALASPLEVTISLGQPVLPPGYIALSVPISFAPERTRLVREAHITLPVDFSLVPDGANLARIDVFRFRPATRDPIAPPFNNLRPRPERGVIELDAEELTTFQAAIRRDAGTPFLRRYTFRAIAGVSMGASGAAAIGFRHHQRFDVIAPLGGYIDWQYMLHFTEQYFLGGFCKVGQGCRVGQDFLGKVAPELPFQPAEDFNDWFPNDNGGNFDRSSFVQFFQDFAFAFGNPAYDNPASSYLPPGVPESYLTLSDGDRCRVPAPLSISGMCNAEYNPDGAFPVLPFCDGEDGPPPGVFDPTQDHTKPVEVLLAVDVDGNGKRDYAEPVFVNARERFDDVGADGIPDEKEVGLLGAYDPVKNPDPAGDNYHWFYNPNGTEGNWVWDPGEPFRDDGLDGVPAHGACTADYGEGNGRYDLGPNVQNYFEHSPRTWLPRLSADDLARLQFWLDGGLRDFAGAAVSAQQVVGALSALGLNIRAYTDFNYFMDDPTTPYDITRSDAGGLGRSVFLRYGNLDATPAEIAAGDGKHVGTIQQALNRFLALFKFIDSVFPGGDYTRTRPSSASSARNEVFFSPAVAVCRDPGSKACYHPSSFRGCAADEECRTGERCYFASCRTEPAGSHIACNRDSDCHGGESCLASECVMSPPSCRSDADCADDSVCEDRSCSGDSGCDPGERCVYGVCRKASGSQTKCVSAGDCPGNEICFGDRTYLTVLPPGYDDPENATLRYPVVYVFHGYGMEPRDLAATFVISGSYMATGVLQKMIFVYPDGKCYLGECRTASWYSDHPAGPDGVVKFGYESSVLELMDLIDAKYRTKPMDVLEDRR
jgi:hypothetical protein